MRGGYYHTGDVASRDADGYITYVGRTDDVFKASDYRISPFELESVLIEHEAVAEAAVVPSPDPLRLAVPKAYVVLAAGLRAHARDRAGDPALRPRAPRAVQAHPPDRVLRAAQDDLGQDPPRRAARARGGRRRRRLDGVRLPGAARVGPQGVWKCPDLGAADVASPTVRAVAISRGEPSLARLIADGSARLFRLAIPPGGGGITSAGCCARSR